MFKQSVILLFFIANQAVAENRTKKIMFLDLLPKAIEIDQSLASAKLSYKAATENAKASRSSIYPDATITMSSKEQDDVKIDAVNDQYTQREIKLEINQSLYDFGEKRADIDISDLRAELTQLSINSARNNSILGAAQSYIRLKGANTQLNIALDSEKRLKKQTGLQDFKVKKGAAVATDVLQAKNALAGAISRKVFAQGNFELAINDFETKFGFIPKDIDNLQPINVPTKLIPKNKDDFRNAVYKSGDQNKQSKLTYKISEITKDKSFAQNFLPSLDFTSSAHYKQNDSGTRGGKTEYIAKVELTLPIELFGTQINKHNSNLASYDVSRISYNQSRRNLDNMINSSWISYINSKMNQSNIVNQVEIARQFLNNSQAAVKKGRGEMALIVNAQNALVNAEKSLESTNTNFALQIYSMLSQMGKLSVKTLILAK